MIYAAGIDVGSTQTKGIILNDKHEIVARALTDTGAYVTRAAERCFVEALQKSGVKRENVACIVGTGYGRYKVTFGDAQITEISCHARGASYLFPNTRTVIDMGGQDAKGIKIGEDGDVKDFVMNDKCAAGTGRFLASAADALGMGLGDIGESRSRRKIRCASPPSARYSSSLTLCLTSPKAKKPRISSAACTALSRHEPFHWCGASALSRK